MLTARQAQALAFIDAATVNGGQPPSYKEIADGLGIASKGAVHQLVQQLEKKGYIRRLRFHHRCIEVIRRPPVSAPPPLVRAGDRLATMLEIVSQQPESLARPSVRGEVMLSLRAWENWKTQLYPKSEDGA